MKVLMIEDDMATRIIFKFKLKNSGFEMACAETLKEAFTKLKSFTPDLITLDLNLAVENYKFTIPAIPKLKAYAPVIVVSGILTPDIEKGCEDVGAVACISKHDFCSDSIVNMLRTYYELYSNR